MRYWLGILLIVLSAQALAAQHVPMTISSPEIKMNRQIPPLYTCRGKSISPPLVIKNVPDRANSLVLLLYDPSVSDWRVRSHWVVWDLPPKDQVIPKGVLKLPEGTHIGINSWGNRAYQAPCPTTLHYYYFSVFALSRHLYPKPQTREGVIKAMQKYVIAGAALKFWDSPITIPVDRIIQSL